MKVEHCVTLSFERLVEYVELVEPCYYHNGWTDSDGKFHNDYDTGKHADIILEWFDAPTAWWSVIRVMAQGACYYGEDNWKRAE